MSHNKPYSYEKGIRSLNERIKEAEDTGRLPHPGHITHDPADSTKHDYRHLGAAYDDFVEPKEDEYFETKDAGLNPEEAIMAKQNGLTAEEAEDFVVETGSDAYGRQAEDTRDSIEEMLEEEAYWNNIDKLAEGSGNKHIPKSLKNVEYVENLIDLKTAAESRDFKMNKYIEKSIRRKIPGERQRDEKEAAKRRKEKENIRQIKWAA